MGHLAALRRLLDESHHGTAVEPVRHRAPRRALLRRGDPLPQLPASSEAGVSFVSKPETRTEEEWRTGGTRDQCGVRRSPRCSRLNSCPCMLACVGFCMLYLYGELSIEYGTRWIF